MSTEAQRLEWYKRKDLVKRGKWRADFSDCAFSWRPKFSAGWDRERLTHAISASWLGRSIWLKKNYAWYTPQGEFVWGTLGL